MSVVAVNVSRYRLWLPVVFGFIAAVLAALEVCFSNAIIDSGRTMHTGAPDWPFHEPGLLLMSINLPGWVFTLPIVLIFSRMLFWAHCLVAGDLAQAQRRTTPVPENGLLIKRAERAASR